MTAIDEKFAQLGGAQSFLGAPSGLEQGAPDGIGRFRHFANGSLYWAPSTGAYEVHGAIRDKWASLGWERSGLGYPVSDETSVPGGTIRYSQFQRGLVYWIGEPDVTRAQTDYPNIRLPEGSVVTIDAGGCVQTGGHGKTWKRYVDPQGPNSDRLYHGLVQLPGVTGGLVRIASILGQPKRLLAKDDSADPMYLILGYEDDGYSDNGYSGREGDDGTGDQCRGLGNAYVIVTIQQ
jgi:hypothetical protein